MNRKRPVICVVGSSNYDLIAYTSRVPKQGETILGNDFKMGFGGKGANQAVTAAKLGADVTMVTKLGNDIFGQQTMANYKSLKMNTKFVFVTDKASSGVAPIWVDKSGHNSIIVIPGANHLITKKEVETARKAIAASKIVVCQNEIPLNITGHVLKIAREEGVTTLFNPAPAPADGIPDSILKLTDILCPNESEAEILTGMTISSVDDAISAGKKLISKGVKKIIMTLGSRGSLLLTKKSAEHIPGNKVKAVDTTGAGDCFIGSYAYFSAAGFDDCESIRRANYVASVSVQKHGTQTSYPLAADLPREIIGR